MQISRQRYKDLDRSAEAEKAEDRYDEVDMAQMSLFDTVQDDDIVEELRRSGY